MTEGLMIFTNDGKYARQLELPVNQLWRTYRVRVHGRLTLGKLTAIRKGMTVRVNDGVQNEKDENGRSGGDVKTVPPTGMMVKYKGMKVSIERKSSDHSTRRQRGNQNLDRDRGGTNTWLQITCTEGKNRQLRRILGALGLDVTRLIRISYGDYDLNTIPPGRAVEVPCKVLKGMKKKGPLFAVSNKKALGKAGKGLSDGKRKGNDFDRHGNEEARNASSVEWVTYS